MKTPPVPAVTYSVPPPSAGQRADAFLAGQCGWARSALGALFDSGAVTLRGKPIKKSHNLQPGDALTVVFPEPRPALPEPQDIPLDIVFEDAHLIVLNKPRGLVVHPAPGHPGGTIVNALLHHCGSSLLGVGGVLRPGIVHRLDRDTGGLMMAAKHAESHARLSAMLASREVGREYQALVYGSMARDSGTVDAPTGRHPSDRLRQAVTPRGRAAVTAYAVHGRYREPFAYTHVTCRLHTGRTHQIRVHMAHIGHPVLADPLYAPGRPAVSGVMGQLLHATGLAFTHPMTGEPLRFEVDVCEEMRGLLHG
jgi:23S rRNA pseudouridine1911/1915/1917 synthase